MNQDEGPRHIVLDFHHVSGMDSSALVELHSLADVCDQKQVRLRCADAPQVLTSSFDEVEAARIFAPDLDHALEQAEADLLAREQLAHLASEAVASDSATTKLDAELRQQFTAVDVEAGATLMSAGDENSGLYLVQSGTLTVWAPIIGSARRLRRVGHGAFLGEVGFFAKEAATATVIADLEASVLLLSRDSFDELRESNPELALKLTQQVLALTAQRLKVTNALVGDLMR